MTTRRIPKKMTENSKKLSLKLKDKNDTTAKLEERLHKVLAQAGLGSRRALEQRIADGLIKVNGEVAQTGQSVSSGDKVELDGRQFVCTHLVEPTRMLVYNKPDGEVTTREDPEGRPTVFESLPPLKGARWISIGRLDINTTGLLLLTTDGELANAMMHPSYEVEREYVCRVRAPEGQDHVSDAIIDRLRRGVALDDGPARFDRIERISDAENESHDWFQVSVREGRNREVRRLWESQGCQVSRLKRVRYGNITLPRELRRGQTSELDAEIVRSLRESLGLEDSQPSALTLQPVIGQRRAAKSVINIDASDRRRHAHAEESSELRRFDNFRDERGGRGRGGNKRGGAPGGLTVSGDAAAKQFNKPLKQRREKGPKLPEGSPAAFRSWYVPDGVDTGPKRGGRTGGGPGGRSAGGPGGRGGHAGGPGRSGPGGRSEGRPGRGGPGGGSGRGPARDGGGRTGGRGGPAAGGERNVRGGDRMPYGHPGNAPTFPSDYANGTSSSPFGDRPRSPRGGKPGAGGRGPGGGGPRNAGPGPRGPRGNGPGPKKGGPRGGGGHQGGGGNPWGNR